MTVNPTFFYINLNNYETKYLTCNGSLLNKLVDELYFFFFYQGVVYVENIFAVKLDFMLYDTIVEYFCYKLCDVFYSLREHVSEVTTKNYIINNNVVIWKIQTHTEFWLLI